MLCVELWRMINSNIYVELWRMILVVIIPIKKENLDEIVTVFALFRFQGVTVLCSWWEASQISYLPYIVRRNH